MFSMNDTKPVYCSSAPVSNAFIVTDGYYVLYLVTKARFILPGPLSQPTCSAHSYPSKLACPHIILDQMS